MTVLLYDSVKLEERVSRTLTVWKGWHITMYAFAAIFGILNYIFLQNTMELLDNNCVLYPRKLEFHLVEISDADYLVDTNEGNLTAPVTETINEVPLAKEGINNTGNDSVTNDTKIDRIKNISKREEPNNVTTISDVAGVIDDNVTLFLDNKTHHWMLDASRSLFGPEKDCQFAEYMPIMSTICAVLWITLFIMCPGGGLSRSGLQQPWRILTPALLFSVVLVGLMGHSFSLTNGGLQTFCGAFHNYTNTTTCSAADRLVNQSQHRSWGLGGRAAATRAASAGAWPCWACAAALLLARCLAAPDFTVRRTGVYLVKDPNQKITPYLRISSKNRKRSPNSSPSKRDNISARSEPTATTELVTASVEPGLDSVPTSLSGTPGAARAAVGHAGDVALTHSPQEWAASRR